MMYGKFLGLLSEIENEYIVIPEFQREFKWNRSDAIKLVDSLLKGNFGCSLSLANSRGNSFERKPCKKDWSQWLQYSFGWTTTPFNLVLFTAWQKSPYYESENEFFNGKQVGVNLFLLIEFEGLIEIFLTKGSSKDGCY